MRSADQSSQRLHELLTSRGRDLRGHVVEYDGPTVGGADRWTCSCGDAILWAGGPVYGSATERDCPLLEIAQ